jgi:hypothetical protein
MGDPENREFACLQGDRLRADQSAEKLGNRLDFWGQSRGRPESGPTGWRDRPFDAPALHLARAPVREAFSLSRH